jgi:hypothetical protein
MILMKFLELVVKTMIMLLSLLRVTSLQILINPKERLVRIIILGQKILKMASILINLSRLIRKAIVKLIMNTI